MTDERKPRRATIFILGGLALLLQLIVMILLATDRMTAAPAVPMLALVVVFGLLAIVLNQRRSR